MARSRPHTKNLRTHRCSKSGSYYFLTTCVAGRRAIFTHQDRAQIVLDAIRWLDHERRFIIDAAVVMPDHIHLAGRLGKGSLSAIMHTLKSYSAKRLVEVGIDAPVWQRGYHDHVLRNDEDFNLRLRYLIENPRRAGLVERVADYPYLISPSWVVWE
jgi:REP element-mobilizing transposase RayT